jgi:hypothetical protein
MPNRSGGFMGFWWHGNQQLYLLLEQEKLCFKIEVEDKAQRSLQWENWHTTAMTEAQGRGLVLKRPRRQPGMSMTFAVLAADYRQVNDLGLLDIDRTADVLKLAETLLDSTVARHCMTNDSKSTTNEFAVNDG